MGLSRATFAKLSPYPYLLANLDPSDDAVAPARSNGRAPDEPRRPVANLSSLTHTQGSAVVRIGDTTVICGVRGETILTRNIPNYRAANTETELSEYNLLVPNVDLNTGCAPQFVPGGPPSVLPQTLSSRIYTLLHTSKLIEPDQLRIWHTRPDADQDQPMDDDDDDGAAEAEATTERQVVAYWVLFIDLVFISFDGNPFDAAWTAVLAALRDTKLPRTSYDADKEFVFCSRKDPRPLTMTTMPVACTVAVFTGRETDQPTDGKHWLLMDPDMLEESLCDESATIVVDCSTDETRILSLSKHGGIVLSPKALQSEQFLGWATRRWKDVVAAITVETTRDSTAVDTGRQIDLPLDYKMIYSGSGETYLPVTIFPLARPSPTLMVAGMTLMDSLADTRWDVVISGTGLPQSLLALALSRSDKAILHVDPNRYYGAAEAALSLDEADEWAEKHRETDDFAAFSAARVVRASEEGLSSARTYSLALAPQLIHARSPLLSQLVSSRAYRQVEFLAVGSLYLFRSPSEASPLPTLSRVPSTREDLFADAVIAPRAKRKLIKFLKFVVEYESEPQTDLWKPKADEPLTAFLESEFGLDGDLPSYVVVLTLSLDANISVEAGLFAIHRHITSMGTFGPGFAAVYPKWGGMSEVAQVGCRAGAVGGAVYVLGTGVSNVQPQSTSEDGDEADLEVTLSSGVTIKAGALVEDGGRSSEPTAVVSRLIAVVDSSFSSLFQPVIEDAPVPCVAVVGFPLGSIATADGTASEFMTYAMVHSSDTGECPAGQSVIYLSTTSTPTSHHLLEVALSSLLAASSVEDKAPRPLYQLYYDQAGDTGSFSARGRVGTFTLPPPHLAFPDVVLSSVREAWDMVSTHDSGRAEGYMVFEDREDVVDWDDS
ncbi:hypothetical protein XA68_16102 [Ophiocordyceps unilateralis]|uniref:Uncharacterized protein n=1 Tax=Ophiocordyceps unilateralis TaxID=268505 RepID=A0A2A9P7B1_OPHUN|nr:hypothetical protein XA68_16102 [Ophiocordyceps unilateralis]